MLERKAVNVENYVLVSETIRGISSSELFSSQTQRIKFVFRKYQYLDIDLNIQNSQVFFIEIFSFNNLLFGTIQWILS